MVDSSLSQKLRSKLKLPALVRELLACPVCVGFWIALVLCWGRPIDTLAVGFAGGILYELRAKFLPCKKCTNPVKASDWKVS